MEFSKKEIVRIIGIQADMLVSYWKEIEAEGGTHPYLESHVDTISERFINNLSLAIELHKKEQAEEVRARFKVLLGGRVGEVQA